MFWAGHLWSYQTKWFRSVTTGPWASIYGTIVTLLYGHDFYDLVFKNTLTGNSRAPDSLTG